MSYLHSIYLTGGLTREAALPFRIESNLQSLREAHPDFPHTVYDDHSLRDFIRTNIGRDALVAFDSLLPLAYKADLGRYCLLLERGGLYADLSIHFFQAVADLSALKKLHVFRDGFSAAPWIVSNSIIACPPRLLVFQRMIEKIIEHCRSRYYGFNPLCPTGPNLFGQTLAATFPLERIVCGDTTRINRNEFHSYAYLNGAGDVVATNVKKGIGVSSLGARIHDDYNRQYEARNVYGELAGQLAWSRADYVRSRWVPANMMQQRVWLLEPGPALQGPRSALGPGEYEGIFSFHAIAPAQAPLQMVVEAVCNEGQHVLQVSAPYRLPAQQTRATVAVRFRLEQMTRDVGIRLRLSDRMIVEFASLRIIRARELASGDHHKTLPVAEPSHAHTTPAPAA